MPSRLPTAPTPGWPLDLDALCRVFRLRNKPGNVAVPAIAEVLRMLGVEARAVSTDVIKVVYGADRSGTAGSIVFSCQQSAIALEGEGGLWTPKGDRDWLAVLGRFQTALHGGSLSSHHSSITYFFRSLRELDALQAHADLAASMIEWARAHRQPSGSPPLEPALPPSVAEHYAGTDPAFAIQHLNASHLHPNGWKAGGWSVWTAAPFRSASLPRVGLSVWAEPCQPALHEIHLEGALTLPAAGRGRPRI